ncbi:Integral membrane sensor domain MASE1 [Amycolatopsis xylanica]|uniref:Integral membrane sensor domain MASE1 n=1 Tax=Amycolatopsis xylanica TaxID=589385 RepID=A0A1H3E168_9PSEU|nr:MASE1 domain-containing protein [Amycolatopsis xylanica]SDX72377.1 Integral membrane sensor domain MASE1 [Amycolatopsis xylanica]
MSRTGPQFGRTTPWAVLVLAVAAAYLIGARVGFQLAMIDLKITPLWPPTGIALAALLLFGPRVWPGISLGALAANAIVGGEPIVAFLGITIGNTLAPLTAYYLLKRLGFRRELDRLKDALLLVFAGALGAMLVSATIGSAVLAASGTVSYFWTGWTVWWTGDAMGVLTVAPLLLIAPRFRWPREVPLGRWVEAIALATGMIGTAVVATTTPATLLFTVFPWLIWAALRFEQAGALCGALAVCTIAILAAAHGWGPFSLMTLPLRMITLQALDGSVALTALLLATVTVQRNRAEAEVAMACVQLNEMVARIAPAQSLRGAVLDIIQNISNRPPRDP